MRKLSESYTENVIFFDKAFNVERNFDILKKTLCVGSDELTFYYIDGYTKDSVLQKLMLSFVSATDIGKPGQSGEEVARDFVCKKVAHIESDVTADADAVIYAVMSGAAAVTGSRFGASAVVIDTRTYPARNTEEPQNDRIMRGAKDGFVETLIFNTALIRRRIRDTRLTMEHYTVGSESKTDVVLCYISGKACAKYVKSLGEKLSGLNVENLTMGHQSLAESLIPSGWYNPFPKIRYTERPDVAAAQLYEGSVLILVDTSPEVMVLPTSIFDFMQETNDFYFPPLTGTYLRLARYVIFALTLFLTPIWYLFVKDPAIAPQWLSFALPTDNGSVPILAQLLTVEFIVDGLKMASMNTPDVLSNSLSVVGGLILGDFAVSIGWLAPEVILLMAFVTIANFSQRSYELGYAFKFLRIGILVLTAVFGTAGFAVGLCATLILLCANKTLNGTHSYLSPLIPFSAKGLFSVVFRLKKSRKK